MPPNGRDSSAISKAKLERSRSQRQHRSDDDGEEPSPKRARVNSRGDSSTPPPTAPIPAMARRFKVTPWKRDKDGYIAGSILRIQLQNFVTYDWVEFKPGPYLNMIIGPNGTGKSSVACAIALGLNFPPSILGRATELSSFVKNDKSEGWIEIELKGRPEDKKNWIIKRVLTAKAKSSIFYINGKQMTGKEVTKVIRDLSVQVENLCSFLPQDKVSEFAAMSPQQLLRETQRAAGNENLTAWHDSLISSGNELHELTEKIKHEASTLEQMIERNEGIERDVQRFKERQRIEEEIDVLTYLIPTQMYRESFAKYQAAKAEQRRLHRRVKKLREINAPAHAKQDEFDKLLEKLGKQYSQQKGKVVAGFQKLTKVGEIGDSLDTQTENHLRSLEELKKAEKTRKERIAKAERDLRQLQEQLDQLNSNEKVQAWATELAKLADQTKSCNAEEEAANIELSRVQTETEQFFDRHARAKMEMTQAENDLKNMNQLSNVKLQHLAKWNRDAADAIMWLRANRSRFQQEIFEPPLICVDIKDKGLVDQIEACFPRTAQVTFVAQTQSDADLLNKLINDDGELRRKAKISVWFRPRTDEYRRGPMSPEQLRTLGFEGYAIDFITYPPGLEWYLRGELGLGTIAVTRNSQVDLGAAMNVYGNTGGGKFIVGKVFNNVIKSAYGQRDVSNSTSELAQARNFGQMSAVDPTVKQNAQEKLSRASEEFRKLDAQQVEVKAQVDTYNQKIDEIAKRKSALKSRARKIQEEKQKKATLAVRIERAEKNLDTDKNAEPMDEKKQRILADISKLVLKRVKEVEQLKAITQGILEDQDRNAKLSLRLLQLDANRSALKKLCDEKDDKYNTAVVEFQAADDRFRRAKGEAMDARKASQEKEEELRADETKQVIYARIQDILDATNAYHDERRRVAENGGDVDAVVPGPSADLRKVDELERDLETEQTKLEMNMQTNPGVVEMYEKRKRDIEQLAKTIDERREKARRKEKDIKNAKDNWYPALQELVASIGRKFSAACDHRPGCAGEIRIREDEDYAQWAIDIMIKFRDTEKLQLLTAHRQSGGERSFTTILYLLSLSEEARAPFSLVDEINQGMDHRAERSVHNLLVNVTCKPESGQYFLITPKLLPDLAYHELMKVLVVNNGEWLPDRKEGGDTLGNMMNLIDSYVTKRGGR